MSKKAFTLVEIAVVSLIISILFHGIFSLFYLSMTRFSHQESHISMTWEGGMLCSYLIQDFEDAYLTGDPRLNLNLLKSTGDHLILPIGDKVVEYIFDEQSGQVKRLFDGKVTEIGKQLIKQFAAVPEIQFSNGEIKPFSPESLAEAESFKVVPSRIWVKINLVLAAKVTGSQTAEQDLGFYAFPVRLNRQLQSIWKP